jgi:acetoin utilization protein AcuB
MVAKKLIKDVPVITSDTPGIVAMSLMDELKLSHLPVVDNDQCLGVISETSLYAMANPENSLRENGVIPEHICGAEGQHLYEILQLMNEHNLSLLPVVDEQKHFLGCIVHIDLLRTLGEFNAVNEPGGIIVLEVAERDYSLQQIAGIIESNDARVLSIQTSTFDESTKMEVTVKINKMDLRPILQTFARYNYIVSASFQETGYEESLRERYDSLMNYLKL